MPEPAFLSWADHGVFLVQTAAGQQPVIQILWRYASVDRAGLQRIVARLDRGRLDRLVQPAVLPIGRHRWVRGSGTRAVQVADAEWGGGAIEPEALGCWADAQVQRSLDPARGPGWRVAAQPLRDGGTVVSFVVSHCLADGTAAIQAICDAVEGRCPALPFPSGPPASRRRRVWEEGRRFAGDLPAIGRAVVRGVTMLSRAVRRSAARTRSWPQPPPPSMEQPSVDPIVALPSVSVRLPAATWKAVARRHGVNRLTVLTAVAAQVAVRLGRVRAGTVSLQLPVNVREGSADLAANRVALASVEVPVEALDPPWLALQQLVQEAVAGATRGTDLLTAILPLVPLIPRRLVALASRLAFSGPQAPTVTCSHMGVLPEAGLRIDGAPADWVVFRGVDRALSMHDLTRRGGVATLMTGVMGDALLLNLIAYQPGRVTRAEQLRPVLAEVLAALDLTEADVYA